MANVRYVCLSDLHLGEEDSLLTNITGAALAGRLGASSAEALLDYERQHGQSRVTGAGNVDLTAPSPSLLLLAECITDILKHNAPGSAKPTLVLNGDVLELALADMDRAAIVFSQFIGLLMPACGPLFDEIIFLPGNHDHHLWEMARETQYLNYLRRLPDITASKPPWHTTKVFMDMRGRDHLDSRFLTGIARRFPHLERRGTEILTAYPNFGILADNGRAVVFHHGHFIEPLYRLTSTAMSLVLGGEELPPNVYELETDNFAWIDFFWSSLGRSGKAGGEVESIYEATNDPRSLQAITDSLAANVAKRYRLRLLHFDWLEEKVLSALLRRFVVKRITGKQERQRPVEKGGGIPLSATGREGLKQYLKVFLRGQTETEGAGVPDAVSFIFGHTHKPFEDAMKCEGYGQAVKIFNTGGWVVDTVEPDPPHGAAAVLLDEELNAVSLRFFNEGQYVARVAEPLAPGQAHGALYANVAGIVNPGREPWRSLGTTIAREVRRRAKFLESRLRRLQTNPGASSKM